MHACRKDTNNRYEGIYLDEGDASVTLNVVEDGNIGVAAVSFTGAGADSSGTLSCNRISGAGIGIKLIDDDTGDAFIPTVTAHTNAIDGNTVGVDNPTSTTMNATDNWWGCGAGANTSGCDAAVGNVDFTPSAQVRPACVDCTSAAECDDGALCNGAETCNLATGLCEAGTPLTDTDGDGTCDPIDNCATTFNPAQSDGDDDAVGDLCDSAFSLPAPLALKKVKLTSNAPPVPGLDKGRIQIRGTLDTSEYGQSMGDLLAGGLTVAVGGVGLDSAETMAFPGARCLQRTPNRFKCVGSRGEVLTFRRKGGTGNVFNLRLRADHRGFAPPLSAAPVEVVMSLGARDRRAELSCTFLEYKGVANCHG